MSIKEFHDSIRQLLNIGQSKYYNPEDIDLQINNAIIDFYRKEYSHFEATQEITDTLGYYKERAIIERKQNTDGTLEPYFKLPENWIYTTEMIALLSDSTEAQIELIPDAEWGKRKNSVAFGPTLEFPFARYIGREQIDALPVYNPNTDPVTQGVQKLELLYLRQPNKAKFGYKISADGTSFIYDAAGSVEVDYPLIDHPRIMTRALSLLGIPVEKQAAIQSTAIVESQSEGR